MNNRVLFLVGRYSSPQSSSTTRFNASRCCRYEGVIRTRVGRRSRWETKTSTDTRESKASDRSFASRGRADDVFGSTASTKESANESRERQADGASSLRNPRVIKITDDDADDRSSSIAVIAKELLLRGETIALPTDTLYGFACDSRNARAIEKMYEIKERDKEKPFAICVSDWRMIEKVCVVPLVVEAVLEELFPGAVTVLLKRRTRRRTDYDDDNSNSSSRSSTFSEEYSTMLSESLNPNVESIGVRVPDSAFIRTVCKEINGAIALTSANASGKPSCVCVEEFSDLHQKVAAVFDGGKIKGDESKVRSGSTIVDLSLCSDNCDRSSNKTFSIVRDGCALEETKRVLFKHGFTLARDADGETIT